MLSSITRQGHIMVVDDEKEIRDILRILLSSENFKVTEATTPSEALRLMVPDIDLVILDVTMPEMSGYDLCRQIREVSNVPILFLTARNGNSDLNIVYQGRHTPKPKEEYLTHGNLRIDSVCNHVWKNSIELELTDTEYRILKLLVAYPGQLFTVQNIYETIWEEEYLPSSSNTVMVFIRKIREKIEDDPKNPAILVTVWGKGYKIAGN